MTSFRRRPLFVRDRLCECREGTRDIRTIIRQFCRKTGGHISR